MENRCVLLDTNFLIQFVNDGDLRHEEIHTYFRSFLDGGNRLKLSTICVAEYCVRGQLDELPLRNLEVLPFNIHHSQIAGNISNWLKQNKDVSDLYDSHSIKDDTKILAQIQVEKDITAFATSDKPLIKRITRLKNAGLLRDFEVFDTNESYSSTFGVLPLTA